MQIPESTLALELNGAQFKPFSDIARYQDFFLKNNFLKLPKFIPSALAGLVKTQLAQSHFISTAYKVGKDETTYNGVHQMISFLMKSPQMYEAMGTLSNRRLEDFFGRTFRLNPPNKGYSWHTDMSHTREVGVSICLSPKPYEGGTLIMRNQSQGVNAFEIPNLQFGDAVLFGIGNGWDHMVSPVVGSEPKIISIGWYCSEKITGRLDEDIYDN